MSTYYILINIRCIAEVNHVFLTNILTKLDIHIYDTRRAYIIFWHPVWPYILVFFILYCRSET